MQSVPQFFEFYYKSEKGLLNLDNSCVLKDEKLMSLGSFYGFDNISGVDTFFEITSPVLRESVTSKSSRCINRIRQMVVSLASIHGVSLTTSLEDLLKTFYLNKRILLLEDVSAFASVLKHYCKRYNIELFTSEFLGQNKKPGEVVSGTLHVDIQKTHFPDNFFDLILHTEVFEHVPDATAGEKEIARILNKNGSAIFTVPFEFDRKTDNIYAELTSNGIKFFQEPIYHEDPVSEDGKCLVFRTFSLPEMSSRFNALGCTFRCEYFHSQFLGILGNNAFTFIAQKR